MKKISLFLVFIISLMIVGVYALGYHGSREFSGLEKYPNSTLVINNARTLIGTPYDPLMGMYGDIGSKAGFIVCSDVPNLAYGMSGFSWKEALKKDFEENPNFYNSEDGNKPGNPFFHRRARNLYSYFKANGKLITDNVKPKIGDLVFYRKTKNGYISHVALVSEITQDGYNLIESAPKTLLAQEVAHTSPIERGWIYAGFGSVNN